MQSQNTKKQAGFTLIELLVVIAIIGMLASVVLTSLNITRKKARDSQRVANLRVLRDALAIYHNDNGNYPTTGGVWQGGECGANYITGLTPNYIRVLPKDPACGTLTCIGATSRDFLYRSNGTDYKLIIDGCFETTQFTTAGKPFADPARTNLAGSFGAVYSTGGSAW